MKKNLLLLTGLCLLTFPAWADKEAKIKELIKIQAGNMNQLEQVISQSLDPAMIEVTCLYDIPASEAKNYQDKLVSAMDVKSVLDSYIPFYEANFTEPEIDELLKFQKSAVGKKMASLQPKLAQFMMQQQQQAVPEMMKKFTSIASEIESKYQKRSKAEYYQCKSTKAKTR